MRKNLSILTLLLSSLAVGCDDRADSGVVIPPPPAKIEHPGTVSGSVTFTGKAPQLPRLTVSGDPHCAGAHPDGLPDESVVVAGDGALANVFVYLKGAPRWDGSGREPALIDQVNCQYVPHVVGIQVNQALRVKSSDTMFHNVHMLGEENPQLNFSQNAPGETVVRFKTAEIMHTRCDVHPWMKAVIGVFDNPYFAVTGPDGKFSFGNVPPGSYTLAAWQERLGEMTKKITVAPDGTIEQDFVYGP